MLDDQPEPIAAQRTPEQQKTTRDQLEQDIQAFLANGGSITSCDTAINRDPVYSRSQRDSRRARDRMRLRRVNSSLVKEYREKLKTEPGYLLSKREFCELMGISETCVKQWKTSHPIDMEDILRPVVLDPYLWDLQEFIHWYEQLKAKTQID